jgi:rhodanese-related sulfurtransferase
LNAPGFINPQTYKSRFLKYAFKCATCTDRYIEARLPEVRALVNDAQPAGVYCVCSRGNDSQRAEVFLRAVGLPNLVGDVLGGLERWREDIDPSFPKLV